MTPDDNGEYSTGYLSVDTFLAYTQRSIRDADGEAYGVVIYGPEYGAAARCVLMILRAPEPVEHAYALLHWRRK